jgi:hypothetical protein
MEGNTKASIRMIKSTDLEYIPGSMEENTRGAGKMGSKMGRENIS